VSVSTELTRVHPQKRLSTAHHGLYTLAIRIEDGYFVVEHENGAAAIRNGRDLAASIPAKWQYGADIRIWIDRPAQPAALARLRDILCELADLTGAVVWGPPGAGYCDVIPAAADLAAFNGNRTTARWQYYQPEPRRPLRYSTDPDGRLIPAGGLVLQSCPAVALISVPGRRMDSIAHRYADVPPRNDFFIADLTVLENGRPAACCTDGSLFVLGPRSLARTLNAHGWTGQPIALVAELDPTQRAGLRQYVRDVNTALGQNISIVPADELPPVRRHATVDEIGDRLTSMVEELIHELPSLQQQFRTLAAADQSRYAALFDVWFRLHRCLAEARYSPAVRELWAGRRPAPDHGADALARSSALADASAAAREFVGSVKLLPPTASNLALPYVDARWDKHVRPSIALALSHLDPADPDQASQLRQLTQALMALATLTAVSTVPPHVLDDARALIERAVVGASNPPEYPADPEPTQLQASTTEMALPEKLVQAAISDAAEPDVDPHEEIFGPDPTRTKLVQAAISDAAEPDVDPHEEIFGPDPTRTGEWAAAAMFLARPHLEKTTRRSRPHGLAWLPDIVQANDSTFELFVGSHWSPDRVADQGFPSSRLFLVGHLGAQSTNAAHSVRVRVEPQGAVDLLACGIEPPSELGLHFDAADAYVLPAGWLDRCRIILDDDGSTTYRPVSLRCCGGSHGIDGLPEEVSWGPRGWRKSPVVYAFLTDYDTAAKSGLRLYRNKPATNAGRLVELRVGPGLAIDIADSEAKIKGFPSVRTILPELRAGGVDMQLPPSAFAEVKVTGAFIADGHQWKPTGPARPSNLASLLASAPAELA
jgi:hypothetical protein